MCGLQKLPGNAVGQKRLAHTGAAVEKQVLEPGIKIPDKILRGVIRVSGRLQRRLPRCFVLNCIRIPVKRKVFKILFFKNFTEIGLGIQKFDLGFFEAEALPASYISGVLALRTDIMRFQIIGRIAVLLKE